MASIHRASRSIPSSERNSVVTDLASSDGIDVKDILGRPANGIRFITDNTANDITVIFNNRLNIQSYYPKGYSEEGQMKPETIEVVSQGAQFPSYYLTGSLSYDTDYSLKISYIYITDITGDWSLEVW